MTTLQIHVQGMSCNGCAQSIERRLRATVGVQDVTVDFSTGIATISFDETTITLDALENVIESLGFDVV